MADIDLERHFETVCIEKLKQFEHQKIEEFQTSMRDGVEPLIIRTAHPVNDQRKDNLRQSIEEVFFNGELDKEINFHHDPDLIAGIELQANGRRISWSIEEYLNELDERILEIFHREARLDKEEITDQEA
jgi:F-type H+-transporting ATPase subunit b